MGGIFSILSVPLGFVMDLLYQVVQSYGWTIIIFTFLLRVVMFPVMLNQQKSLARQSAFNPMIQEIQKKWANDKNRQNQEMQKFMEENNVKMTAGCLPMIVNLLVMFSMISVIQMPMNYILRVDAAQVNNGYAILQQVKPELGIIASGDNSQQSRLIEEIKNNPQLFTEGMDVVAVDGVTYVLDRGQRFENGTIVDQNDKVVHENAQMHYAAMDTTAVQKVQDFKFDFLGMNLARAPEWKFDIYLIMPILSIIVQLASQVIIMRFTPGAATQSKGQMWMMNLLMAVMFGFYAIRMPVGFSLYYTTSSVAMTVQQLVLKRIYDPDKIREQILAEMEERKKAKKAKKKVKVKTEQNGEVVSLELSEAELNKLRLKKARELDAQRYADEEANSTQRNNAEKARQLDEEKYGPAAPPTAGTGEADAPAEDGEVMVAKPGRRKKARQKKDSPPKSQDAGAIQGIADEKSFAESEAEQEQKEAGDDA